MVTPPVSNVAPSGIAAVAEEADVDACTVPPDVAVMERAVVAMASTTILRRHIVDLFALPF
jgi:hypothetical protein